MRKDRVRAAGDERVIGIALCAVAKEDILRHGVELVFADAGNGRSHRFENAGARRMRRLSDQRELARTLDQSQRIDRRCEISNLELREACTQERDELSFARWPAVP